MQIMFQSMSLKCDALAEFDVLLDDDGVFFVGVGKLLMR